MYSDRGECEGDHKSLLPLALAHDIPTFLSFGWGGGATYHKVVGPEHAPSTTALFLYNLHQKKEKDMEFQPRNYRIDNAEFWYAKLDKPVNPFGTEQWELMVATDDAGVAEEWKKNHLPVKQKTLDGKEMMTVSLKRKTFKANGEENGPVRMVNADLTPFTDRNSIGNGSRGNVIVFQYPWENMGRKGIASSLTSIQMVEFKRFTPTAGGVDFTAVVGAPAPAAAVEPQELDAPF